MAGRAGDIAVAAQDLVEEELLAEGDPGRIRSAVVVVVGVGGRGGQCGLARRRWLGSLRSL